MEGPDNRAAYNNEVLFDAPFFGYAKGDDPIWLTFREGVGEDCWSPIEAFLRKYPHSDARSSDLTVVVIVCPQTEMTYNEQKKAKGFPGRRWVQSRFLHDQVIWGLCINLTSYLESLGVPAVVPDLLEGFKQIPHPRFTITSQWSHRHAAFAAGLGTFGLCDGLITKTGKAHRLGSVVLQASLEPTPRTYTEIYEHCLFFSSGTCGRCIARCPAGALSPDGHDKNLCRDYLLKTTAPGISRLWPELDGAYGCGLCQSAVPCGNRRPAFKS